MVYDERKIIKLRFIKLHISIHLKVHCKAVRYEGTIIHVSQII